MELRLSVDLETGQQEEVDFTLCGWYTDYVDPVIPPAGYTSEAQARQWGMSLEEPDLLLICQKNTMDGYQIEDRLYEDIPVRDRTQRFLGGNPYLYSAFHDFIGGYGMAAFCAALVLAGVFFLIYNIFGISMQKEIRQIGLLDTLGTTQRQIRAIYMRQTVFTICEGVVLGMAGSAIIILLLVPRVLGNLYLYNYGKSAELLVFRPELFGASVLFTVVVVFVAAAVTIYRAARLTPLEALHYTGAREAKAGKERLKRQAHWRYKKRCFLTIVSLFLGVVTALGAVVLTKGTDTTYSIEKGADFTISGNILGQLSEEMIAQNDPEGAL